MSHWRSRPMSTANSMCQKCRGADARGCRCPRETAVGQARGAVAFSRTGDLNLGRYSDATIHVAFGELPADVRTIVAGIFDDLQQLRAAIAVNTLRSETHTRFRCITILKLSKSAQCQDSDWGPAPCGILCATSAGPWALRDGIRLRARSQPGCRASRPTGGWLAVKGAHSFSKGGCSESREHPNAGRRTQATSSSGSTSGGECGAGVPSAQTNSGEFLAS